MCHLDHHISLSVGSFITFEMTINVKTKTEKESKGVAFNYNVEENKDQEVEDCSSLWIIG